MKYLLLIPAFTLLFACNGPSPVDNKASADKIVGLQLDTNSIINLYDAFGKDIDGLTKDFGFSCLINYRGKKILFDAGTNADIFGSNVEALGIDLTDLDMVIASHAHFDHINGMDYLLEKNPDVKIYFPFDPFWGANFTFNLGGKDTSVADSMEKHMLYFDGDYKDYTFDQSGRFWNANVEFIKEDMEVISGVRLVTTSSPYMGYFNKYPKFKKGMATADDVSNVGYSELNELSLSLDGEEGEILIVGCSHSTVETIIEKTIEVTNNDIGLVYGGYHLLPYEEGQLEALALRLKNDLKVKKVAPAHCTGHLAFKTLMNHYEENYVFAGLGEIIEF